MKAILIDDETNNIENLQLLLVGHCPFVSVVGTAKNAEDGIKLIQDLHPDIVFLDIQMPGKNGFELLKSLHQYDFEVIFVTAFDQYAIQAVRFAAIDYLLKPIVVDDLKDAVQSASSKILAKQKNPSLENLMQILQQERKTLDDKIALPSAKEVRFIKVNTIFYCESKNNYTIFYLDNEKIIVSKPIFEYEELLQDYGFFRCHNSYLVNRVFVKSLRKEDGGFLVLDNGIEIPISRTKKEEVKKWLTK